MFFIDYLKNQESFYLQQILLHSEQLHQSIKKDNEKKFFKTYSKETLSFSDDLTSYTHFLKSVQKSILEMRTNTSKDIHEHIFLLDTITLQKTMNQIPNNMDIAHFVVFKPELKDRIYNILAESRRVMIEEELEILNGKGSISQSVIDESKKVILDTVLKVINQSYKKI